MDLLLRFETLAAVGLCATAIGYAVYTARVRARSLAVAVGGQHSSIMTRNMARLLRTRPELQRHVPKEGVAKDIATQLADEEGITDLSIIHNVTLCVEQILNAQRALKLLDALRSTAYDSEVPAHERLLDRLWTTTFPEVRLDSRISEQWKSLGFQGTDAATDFRGGGILSLLMLLYNNAHAPELVHRVLRDLPPTAVLQSWYPYAVASINFTCDTMQFARSGDLDFIFYEVTTAPSDAQTLLKDLSADRCLEHPAVLALGKYLVRLFNTFHDQWMVEHPHTMEFNIFKDKFYQNWRESL